MSRTTGHYEDTELAMFAMQLLESEEHHATAEHVRDCAFCRQELARLQGDLATCAYGVEMYAPAATVRERVMHRAAREKKPAPATKEEIGPASKTPPVPVEPEEEPRLEFRRRGVDAEPDSKPARRRRSEDLDTPARRSGTIVKGVFGWLGWAIAAGFTVVGVRMYQQQIEDRARLASQAAEVTQLQDDAAGARRLLEVMNAPSAQRVLLSPPEADPGSMAEGHVIYEPEKGSLILLAEHLAPVGINKTYELWLIPTDGSNPIPAGTFHPDSRGNGSVVLPSLPKAVPVKAFGITVEDGAGSQSPTLPIVLAGS